MNKTFTEALNKIINKGNNTTILNLYNNMSTYQKKIFDELCNDENYHETYSLNDLIFDFDMEFVQTLLEIELDLYLEECKNKGIENKRNGYTKDIKLEMAHKRISFNRPRLRYEKNFESQFIPKRTRILNDLNDNIILLFTKNNSVNDIKEILEAMFGINISTGYISGITQTLNEKLLQWRNKQLNKCYFAINIDCMYISIRENKELSSHKLPVYIAVGTNLLGKKEIVGMYLGNEDSKKNIIDSLCETDISESKTFWLEVIADLKDRGVEEVLYFISDGVTGIKDAIESEFPNAHYQRCVVHIVRNLSKYVNKKETYIIKDFKKIYAAKDKNSATLYAYEFLEKYSDRKALTNHVRKYIEEIMPLFDIPINIRKYIYTNNIVESANSRVRRGFYGRGALPNAASALNIIYVNLLDLEKTWSKAKVPNWSNIFSELSIVHENELKKYLN